MVTSRGSQVFTGDDVVAGKEVFQRADLMDFGSLYGSGAYLGPDWGTDYLHRLSTQLRDLRAQRDFGTGYQDLRPQQRAIVDAAVRDDLRTNRYDHGTLVVTEGPGHSPPGAAGRLRAEVATVTPASACTRTS